MCCATFCSLYGVTYGRIRRLQGLLLTTTSPLDCRGMNDAQKKIPADWIQIIIHSKSSILSFCQCIYLLYCEYFRMH